MSAYSIGFEFFTITLASFAGLLRRFWFCVPPAGDTGPGKGRSSRGSYGGGVITRLELLSEFLPGDQQLSISEVLLSLRDWYFRDKAASSQPLLKFTMSIPEVSQRHDFYCSDGCTKVTYR